VWLKDKLFMTWKSKKLFNNNVFAKDLCLNLKGWQWEKIISLVWAKLSKNTCIFFSSQATVFYVFSFSKACKIVLEYQIFDTYERNQIILQHATIFISNIECVDEIFLSLLCSLLFWAIDYVWISAFCLFIINHYIRPFSWLGSLRRPGNLKFWFFPRRDWKRSGLLISLSNKLVWENGMLLIKSCVTLNENVNFQHLINW
jgi:hypothetical protein